MEDDIKDYFNEIDGLTVVCRLNHSPFHGDYRELEVGKTYKVTHIGVLRSSTNILLDGFGAKWYSLGCFDLYENGKPYEHNYADDIRFWPPVTREKYYPEYIAEETEKKSIPAHLKNIEYQYDVKILLAVATGSRAWGWASPNSDWDVRFIYVHKPEWYFKIEPQRDVIEKVTGDNVDLAGWELRKALYLLKRSNPSLLEWLNSPTVFCLDEEFGRRIHEIEKDYFNPIKSMYHYNGMFIKYNERYLGGEGFPIKGFIYYLRGVLSCKWIETKQSLPPTKISNLLDATVEDQKIRSMIDDVIKIKKGELKSEKQVVDDSLVYYARELADYYNGIISSFRPELNETSADVLDSILYDMVNNR